MSDDDLSRRRRELSERVGRIEDDLYGFAGKPGWKVETEEQMSADRAAMRAEFRAVREELKATNVEVAGVKLFNHEIRTTVRVTVAVCTVFGTALGTAVALLISWLK